VTRDDAWRLWLVILTIICFLFGSIDLPGIVLPLEKPVLLGAMSSVASAMAWALSTTFKSAELSAGANIMAAVFAAMSTGFFVPLNQIA